MKVVTISANVEAFGHPSECQEPAPGTVESTSSHNIRNTDADGNTSEIASVASANIHFDSHAHSYAPLPGCHDTESHDIDPDSSKVPNIFINGSPIYMIDNPVTNDPTSGGDVNITDAGDNNTLDIQQ